MASTINTTTSESYSRDRDYSKQLKWTCELNKDLYNCYKKARKNAKNGYMKRLKVLREDLHPELSYFNGKYLSQQSTYVTERGYILETRTGNDEEINVIAENPVRPSTAENDNITEMISTTSQAENIQETIRTVNSKELYDTLQRDFEANYKVYESIETERTEFTTVRKKSNDEELSLINLFCEKMFR